MYSKVFIFPTYITVIIVLYIVIYLRIMQHIIIPDMVPAKAIQPNNNPINKNNIH